jgi:hypothetical protein
MALKNDFCSKSERSRCRGVEGRVLYEVRCRPAAKPAGYTPQSHLKGAHVKGIPPERRVDGMAVGFSNEALISALLSSD